VLRRFTRPLYIVLMNLFFVSNTSDTGLINVTGEEHQHLSRVLRLHEGDSVLLNDGSGSVYEAVIERLERDAACCRVIQINTRFNEPALPVVLLQAIMKNPGKMDWIVEKGTELGMTELIPILTQRSVRVSVKTSRLRNLAAAAVKQCLRAVVPVIREAVSLSEAVEVLGQHRLLLFHEAASLQSMPETLVLDDRPLALFIGPEGGFSDEEVEMLRGLGADVLSLGSRRLRGETAAIAALTRVLAQVDYQTASPEQLGSG